MSNPSTARYHGETWWEIGHSPDRSGLYIEYRWCALWSSLLCSMMHYTWPPQLCPLRWCHLKWTMPLRRSRCPQRKHGVVAWASAAHPAFISTDLGSNLHQPLLTCPILTLTGEVEVQKTDPESVDTIRVPCCSCCSVKVTGSFPGKKTMYAGVRPRDKCSAKEL